MQVTVENLGSLGRRLTVSVPVEQLKSMIQEKMSELCKTAKVPGFRQGKVPKQVLEQRFGAEVKNQAVGKIIETSLPMALQQQNLNPAGRPIVEDIQNGMDQDLRYIVSFEVFPEIKLRDYSKISVEKYQVTVKDEDVEKALERLREQFAEWVVIDRPAKEGDRLIIDYTSTLNGKPYENSQGKDVTIVIGSKLFIEGFEEGLLNTKAGDRKELSLTFPKEWRLEKLAGQPVEFTVHVKAVTEKHLAELNEDFAKRIGVPSNDIQEIKQKIRQNLEKQVEETKMARLKDQVGDALLKANPVPVPKALKERETSILHEEMHRRMGNQAEEGHCHHPGLEAQAERRVALGLILNEVIKSENLVPDEMVVKNKIDAITKMFGNADFVDSMYHESNELLNQVRHTVLLDQALDLVLSRSQQEEKTLSVDELFKTQ